MTEVTAEDNPYWHSEGQSHPIDIEAIRSLCFEIFNIFAASAAIAGELEFADEDDDPSNSSLLQLHHEVAEKRALELLLRLCMLVRTYDDVMSQSKHAESYTKHAEQTNGDGELGALDGGQLSLREACNKVIHAREVRPIYDDVTRDAEGEEESKSLWHLSGEIELNGTQNKKAWEACYMSGRSLKPSLTALLLSGVTRHKRSPNR